MNNWYKIIKNDETINFLKLINENPYEFLNQIDKYANNQEIWNALKKLAKNKYITKNCLEKVIYFLEKDDAFDFLLTYKNDYPDLFNKLSKYFIGCDKNIFNYIDKVDEGFISIIPKIKNYKRAIQFLKKFEQTNPEKLSENLESIIKNINENSYINVYLNTIFDSLYSDKNNFINKKYIFDNFTKLPQTYKLKRFIFDNFLEKITKDINEFVDFLSRYGGLYCQNDTQYENENFKNIINNYGYSLIEKIKEINPEKAIAIIEYINLFGAIDFLSKNFSELVEIFGNDIHFQRFIENCLKNDLLDQIGLNFTNILNINNIDMIKNCLYEFSINNKYEYIVNNFDKINNIAPNECINIKNIPGIKNLFETIDFVNNKINKTKLIQDLNKDSISSELLSIYEIFNPFYKSFYTKNKDRSIGNKKCLDEINNFLHNEIYKKDYLYTIIENNKEELLPNSYEKFINIVDKYGDDINKIKEKFNNERQNIWGQIMLPLHITYSDIFIQQSNKNGICISLCLPIDFCIELSKYINLSDLETILQDCSEFSYDKDVYTPIVDVCFDYDINRYAFVLYDIKNRLETVSKAGLDFKNEIDNIAFNIVKNIMIENNSSSLKLYVVIDDDISDEKINYRMMLRKFTSNNIDTSEYSKLNKIVFETYQAMNYKYFIIEKDTFNEIEEKEYKKHEINNRIVINSLLKLFAIEKGININSYTKREILENLYKFKVNEIRKNTKIIIKEKLIDKLLFKAIIEKNKQNIRENYYSKIISMLNKYSNDIVLIDWDKYDTRKWGYLSNELPPIKLNGFDKELVDFIVMTPLYEE